VKLPDKVTMKECLIILAKQPIPGKVKTRLAKDVGADSAADLYECFLSDLIKRVKKLAIPIVIFCDQKNSVDFFLKYNVNQVFIQRGNSIGDRMHNSFVDCFNEGFSSAILIGSDSPDIPYSFFEEAKSSLSTYDMVIGPTNDEGYYLIGFRSDTLCKDIFADINWSTSKVWKETKLKILNNNINCYFLSNWYDIDNITGLRHYFLHNIHSMPEPKTINYIKLKDLFS